MATRIDAATRTDASVKRLRLPPSRIWRKQQGLKQTTHRFVLAALSLRSHRLACWPWCALNACYCSCVKLWDFPNSTVSSRFLNYNGLTGDVNELSLSDLLTVKGLIQLLCSVIK